MKKTVVAVVAAALLAFAGVALAPAADTDKVVDPAPAFWGTYNNTTFRNLNCACVFGLRSSANVTVDGGSIGGTPSSPYKSNASVIGAVSNGVASSNITIRNLTIHDMAPVNSGDHHEGLYVSVVTGIKLENLRFERVYANTADVFFTGWEAPGNATSVTVTGTYFGKPTNGAGNDAIQWNDTNGPMHDYRIEGDLFDGSQMNFGTLKKNVTNFVIGVNYGTTPSAAQISAAKARGVTFLELPFRPASEWPGPISTTTPPPTTTGTTTTGTTTTAPTTTVIEPPPPPPYAPACAPSCDEQITDLRKQVADASAQIIAVQAENANLQAAAAVLKAKIDQARAALE